MTVEEILTERIRVLNYNIFRQRLALSLAVYQFGFYVRQNMEKMPPDTVKAETNAFFERECREALIWRHES